MRTGYCDLAFSLNPGDRTLTTDARCTLTGDNALRRDTAKSCKSGSGFGRRTWSYPITTFRRVRE